MQIPQPGPRITKFPTTLNIRLSNGAIFPLSHFQFFFFFSFSNTWKFENNNLLVLHFIFLERAFSSFSSDMYLQLLADVSSSRLFKDCKCGDRLA